MTCDICNKEVGEEIFFGEWVKWCKGCAKEGKAKDWELVYENEVIPSLEDGDFSMLSGEVQEMMTEYM